MRVLVLHYSKSGHTQKVAKLLADQLKADLGEISCSRYHGWQGGIAMAWDIFTRARPPIQTSLDAKPYDLTIVGGPVWAGHPAPPLCSFLLAAGGRSSRYGLFLTCGGTSPKYPPEPALSELVTLSQGMVVATGIFREAQFAANTVEAAVLEFAHSLENAQH